MAEGAQPGDLDGRTSTTQVKEELKEGDGKSGGEEAESAVREWLGLLVKAGICAVILYQFVFQVFTVKQNSMSPNFREDDLVLTEKLTYRFRTPRTGDVVVFELWASDGADGRWMYRDYIKRVIAVGGDEVKLVGGKVQVNGVELNEPYLGEDVSTPVSDDVFCIPPGHLFVLGDNRPHSNDSKSGLGLIPVARVKGLVRCTMWPWR